MAASNLHTSAGQIAAAMEDLQTAWLDASQHWNDGVTRRFCENHLEPLAPVVKLALDSIARMSGLVDHMHRDCDR